MKDHGRLSGFARDVRCIVDCRDKIGEGAFWCPDEQAIYWLDVPMPSLLHRFIPATGRHDVWPMPEMITAMAKRADGTLLIASERGINFFDPRQGKLAPQDLSGSRPAAQPQQ